MQPKIQLTYNGQSFQQQDLNQMGISAANGDDSALQEIVRMQPLTSGAVSKGVQSGTTNLVTAATGGVYVEDLRAYVGSRTSYHYDIRSQDVGRQFVTF